MSGIAAAIARMPRSAQGGAMVVVALVLAVVAGMVGGIGAAVTVVVGAAIVGGAVAAHRAFLLRRDERRASPFAGLLAGTAAGPTRIAEPARRARLDELRKSFETGLEKFRSAGKSLYSVPWYVLIGEPGSGKTEAVRHCGVGFPPGLQDELQGAGGTLNMSWWFTNQAVILDTAGRLLFEEVEAGSTSEWQEFLKLLRKSRPNCPVNGLLVVIPADSLIKDSDEVIDSKAARLGGQLDTIQKLLGVRFPAYVVITKSDLVNGFREFFDRTDDPRAANQILGWSNPDALDAPFRPALVEEHLGAVEQRLNRRRMGLMLDPVHTDDARKRRLDQVDALYAFPDSLSRLGPRLRRYLDRMFVAGEWSARPLFLRGIYFTSALREGAALDADLAAALNVSPDKLPEGRIWERERALFLKDLFLSKVFREKGLVTRAADTAGMLRARAATLLGACAAGLLVIGLLTWLGARGLQQAAIEPAKFWSAVASAMESGTAPSVEAGRPPYHLPIVSKAIVSDEDFKYRGDAGADASLLRTLPVHADSQRIGAIHTALGKRASERIGVPVIFFPAAVIAGDLSGSLLSDGRRTAVRTAFEASVLRPLTEAAAHRLGADIAEGRRLSGEATQALGQLIGIEAARATGTPGQTRVQIDPLLRFALAGNEGYLLEGASDDARELQLLTDSFYTAGSGSAWPPESLAVDRSALIVACVQGLAATIGSAAGSAAGPAGGLIDALVAFAASEQRLVDALAAKPSDDAWLAEFQSLRDAADDASARLPALSGRRLEQAAIQDAVAESSRLRDDAQRIVASLDSAGATGPLADARESLRAAAQSAGTRRVNLDELSALASALAETHLGRGVEPLFAARLAAYQAIAALAESAHEPVPGIARGEAAPHFAAVESAAAQARDTARAVLRSADQGDNDPRYKAGLGAIESAVTARRASIARAVEGAGAVTEQSLLAAAQRLAATFPAGASQPTVPLARKEGMHGSDPGLDPRAAVPVIVETLTAASVAPPGSAAARDGPPAALGLLRLYTTAWTDGVALAAAADDRLAWGEFQRQLDSAGRAASIRESLGASARTQSVAAATISRALSSAALPPEARQSIDRLSRLGAASLGAAENPALDSAYDRVLASWKALGSDPVVARRRLIDALRTPAGAPDYLVVSLGDPRETDLVARWWRSLTLAGIRTLSREAQRAASTAQPTSGPTARFARFPLARYDAAAGQLTPSELLEARAALAVSTPASGVSIADGVRDPDLAAELRNLAQADMPGAAAGGNSALLGVLPERADQRFACTVEYQPDPAGASGGGTFAAVRVRQQGSEPRTVKLSGGPVSLGSLDYPGASVELEFLASDSPDAKPVATGAIPGPWLGLWLIAAHQGRPVIDADRRLWEVRMPLKSAAGPRTVVLRLNFDDRELPDPALWAR